VSLLADFVIVLVFALVTMFVLAATANRYRAWPVALWFFLLIFLGTWALGAWFEPVGPRVFGFHWAPFALVAVVLALIIATVVATVEGPPTNSPTSPGAGPPDYEVPVAGVGCALSIFFWLFLAVAVASIVARYV
jgi:hypothetical protein